MLRKMSLGFINILLGVCLFSSQTGSNEKVHLSSIDMVSAPCGNDPTQVACWLFSEGSGTTTADGSGNGNTGTLVSATWAADRFGNAGNALQFNGTSQYVMVANNSSLHITSDITIAAWVKPEDVKNQDVVAKADTVSAIPVDGYELALSATGISCSADGGINPCGFGRFNQASSGENYRVDTTSAYTDSDPWTFYAVTYTSADTTLRMYKNDALSNSRVVPALTIAENDFFLGIGAELTGTIPTATRFFHGLLDDIRIYKRALSLPEIKSLYNNITPAGFTCNTLQPQQSTATTGETPMSKVWSYDGKWWAVFPASSGVSEAGAWLWQLDGTTWDPILKLSSSTTAKADVKPAGDPVGSLVHILLYNGTSADLASVEYNSGTYQLWSLRSGLASVSLPGSETATIDIDSTGRMWLNSQQDVTSPAESRDIIAFYSDSPYSTWSSPIILTSGTLYQDDISLVTALPNNTIGVLWSNQVTKRFEFRYHIDGANPSEPNWSAIELPTSQYGYASPGSGFADNQLNVAVGSDGALYAAIKTGYDTAGFPKIALMVRRLRGTNGEGDWDQNIYGISETGARPIVLLNEDAGEVSVVYSSADAGGDILYRQTAIQPIAFRPVQTMRSGTNNDVSSIKLHLNGEVVTIYSDGEDVNGSLCTAIPSSGVDLAISTSDGVSEVLPGSASTYTIIVTNSSVIPISGVSVADYFPLDLSNVTWTCTASAGSACSPSGAGNINDSVYLDSNGILTYSINATVYPTSYGIINNTATVTLPSGVSDPDPLNNTATDNTMIRSGGGYCGSDPNLVTCYQLDESSGGVYLDGAYGGAYNDGTTVGSPTWVPGIYNQALNLNGTQYGQAPNETGVDIANAITLAAWIKPTLNGNQHLIKKGVRGNNSGYELALATASGSTGAFFFRINDTTSCRIDSTVKYATYFGTWVHVAATYDRIAMHIYVNGAQVDSSTPSCTSAIVLNNLPLTIGAQSDGTDRFTGGIDDVRVYDRALSSAEIALLYNNPPPAFPASPDPADEATAVPIDAFHDYSVSLQTTVNDADSSALTVNFYGRAYCQTPNFTLVALPDTQLYCSQTSGGVRAMFDAQTSWVVNNVVDRNIPFVAGLGDIVNSFLQTAQWDIAGKLADPIGALTRLDLADIPYGLALGNTDGAPNSTGNFNSYFPTSRIGDGHYGSNNDNHYGLFSAGDMDFIVIFLEYNTSPDPLVLNWANQLLQTYYPDRRAIVVIHDLLLDCTTLSTQGQAVYDALKDRPNLFLMLGGHWDDPECRLDLTRTGMNTVYALRSDYQTRTGGNGWLRLMEFLPAANKIQVHTYSPYLNQAETDANSEFELPYDMDGTSCEPFQLITSVTGVTPGTSPMVDWINREYSTKYEWYVTVNDGSRIVTSPIWVFTTGFPTAAALVDFTASSIPHLIQLRWKTAQESELVGFNIYRAEAALGHKTLLNQELIPGLTPGQLVGNNYQYLDDTAETGKLYYYWVEWIGNVSTALFGPVADSLPIYTWLPLGIK